MSASEPRKPVRIAAVGDLHVHDKPADGVLRSLFTDISQNADVLALCGDLTTLARHYEHAGEKRGEIALVIAPPQREASDAEPAETGDLLRDALARGSVKDAVAEVATLTGRSRRELYRQALALREGSRHDPAD